MDNGTTRGEVLVFFCASLEYIDKVASTLTGNCWDGDVTASCLCAADNAVKPEIL